jgi:hypothetical protein
MEVPKISTVHDHPGTDNLFQVTQAALVKREQFRTAPRDPDFAARLGKQRPARWRCASAWPPGQTEFRPIADGTLHKASSRRIK